MTELEKLEKEIEKMERVVEQAERNMNFWDKVYIACTLAVIISLIIMAL